MVRCRRQTSSHSESFQAGGLGASLELGKFLGLLHRANKMEAETAMLGFLIIHPSDEISAGMWLMPGVLF